MIFFRAEAGTKMLSLEGLKSVTAVSLVLLGSMHPDAVAQSAPQGTQQPAPAAANAQTAIPIAPQPNFTEPLFLRPSGRDFTRPKLHFPNPIDPYTPIVADAPRLSNTPRLGDLLRDGKIYLSLNDAVTLALENNFDIAIQRYNLDIADTDLLRARAGSNLLGVSAGLVSGTIGGTTSTITSGGGPGGTSTGVGGAGTGASGLSLSTNGGGPTPEALDPTVTGTIQLERAKTPQATTFITGNNSLTQNTDQYNFNYNQGFITGTSLQVGFNNSRVTSSSSRSTYSPELQSSFKAQVTQHLLQGFGWGVNGRFIIQAKNDRRIADSAFRQQILYTVNQVENIYWGLVSAYEDEKAKERALDQSTKLLSDDQKQLEIGTLAPLDVVNAQSATASDKQALIASNTNLKYQQQVLKQAIARNLDDPTLSAADVIPTDRVSLTPLPEETQNVEDIIQAAYKSRPEVEQSVLTLKNDEITLKGVKNGLLPTLDAFAFYGASAIGGAQSPFQNCNTDFTSTVFVPCTGANAVKSVGYGGVLENLGSSIGPDKGAGFNLTIPIRNRTAQAEQVRSQLEYRQAQLRLQQIYVQIRMQVINGLFALTNDRAQVMSADAAREYAAQSLDAEQKKLRLGASTTANVLQQERNLALAENTLIADRAAYAKDRASLYQILASTLDRYGIRLEDAAVGKVTQAPVIPGLEAPKEPTAPKPLGSQPASQPN